MSNKPTVDARLRELSDPSMHLKPDDIDAIVDHVAKATFSTKRWSVPVHLRVTYHGIRIGTTADSALYHVLKRIFQDRQWAPETTLAEYMADISATVRSPNARIAVFRRWNQTTAVFLAETAESVPVLRQGEAALPFILVLYSADLGKINTAYMVASESAARIPGHARWLR